MNESADAGAPEEGADPGARSPELDAEIQTALQGGAGGESGEPARPPSWQRWGPRALGAVGVVVFVLAVGWLTSDEVADSDAIESEIESSFAQRGVQVGSVTCPDDVNWEVGGEFECSAFPLPGQPGVPARINDVTVEVRMVDDEGTVEFNVPQRQFRR